MMGWWFEDYSEIFWFAVTPITTIPLLVYTSAAYTTDDWFFGKPDTKDNLRNSAIWASFAAIVFSWNAIVHPGKYQWMSPSSAFKLAGHLSAVPAVILPALAVGSAAGYVATSDVHKGATGMLVGDMNMGVPVSSESASWIMNPPTWREFLGID